MPNNLTPLTRTEHADIVASLTKIHRRLNGVKELLAAVHIAHALECLDPKHPINREHIRRSH